MRNHTREIVSNKSDFRACYPSILANAYRIAGIKLSKREYECMQLLIRGATSKMMAKDLGLSYRTVEHYLDNVKIKFNVGNRRELIDKVMRQVL